MEGYKNVSISHKVLAGEAAVIDMHHRCRPSQALPASTAERVKCSTACNMVNIQCSPFKDRKVFQTFLPTLV